MDSPILTFLSVVFGWGYTICWSLSFYSQPLLNYQRKSTSGTTVDFPFINCVGFLAYLTSNSLLYYSSTIREQYAARNHGLTPTVQFNDLTFAAHALVLSCITTSQYFPSLWRFTPSPGTQPSRFILGVLFTCIAGVVAVALVVYASGPSGSGLASAVDPLVDWCALDLVYAISYVKLLITLIKYTPQILVNYRNRSTVGWSIGQILLDMGGGVLSISQQAIDSYQQQDWSGITGNPVKMALGNVSIAYDIIFMTQHYILYPAPRNRTSEGDSLLGQDVENRRLD